MSQDIEVLNAGAVVTIVRNSADPDQDAAGYGGDTWRTYVEPTWIQLDRNRRAEVAEIKQHALDLIGGIVPALANIDTLDLIIELFQAGAFAAGFPTPGSDMERVKDVYIYAKGKIATARTATQAELDSYDATTDPNWP